MARYPDETWRPTTKHGYGADDTHLKMGLVIHSAEGSLAGLFSVLNGSREASWHFSVAQDGHTFQHVDTENIAWTNGSKESNRRFWGIECEGVAGEPLTETQYHALLSVVKWLWATHNPGPPKRGFTLFEHNEMTHYGSAFTDCPSGRIPWERLIADLEEDMPLSDADIIRIREEAVIKALSDPYHQYLQDELQPIKDAIAAISAGGVDVDALAEAVADKLAQRMKE